MKSLANLLNQPAGQPLLADDILELHAARLLLLVLHCGTKTKGTGLTRVDGLTKMAKLDFLVRYPEFFEKLAHYLGQSVSTPLHDVESSMVRFHYGPWDDRYYHILDYLESRELLHVEKDGNTYKFAITPSGAVVASTLSGDQAYADLVQHMRVVKQVAGKYQGTKLKDLIYEVFGKEVVDRKMGEAIT